jgi:uncharacterized protein Yka (UPF0111/DUF47 family)
MFNLLPREEKFVKMLKGLDSQATISVRLLKTLVENPTDSEVLRQTAEGIKLSRREAKKILDSLTQDICRTLITPFDREDIQLFAQTLYKIPKLIGKISDRMLTHGMHSYNGDFDRFVVIIERQSDAMSGVLEEFSGKLQSRTISAKVAILQELEDHGDTILGQLIASSFQTIADPRELILRKDIYEMLEDVTDQYRDAAGVALQIMLKHT